MKSIEELQADLKQIYAELEERKQMEQASVAQTVDFAQLSSKAERVKIEHHPMSGRDEHEQAMYLLMLLSVVSLDDTVYETSFSLVYRIAHGMGFKGDVQELFLQAKQMKFERLDEVTRLFIKDDVRLVLLMECMMLAQCFQKEYKKAMEYVAQLCILMKLEKAQIVFIANFAKVVLTQNVKMYQCDFKNTYAAFDCYLLPLEKSRKLIIDLVRKDCKDYTSHEYRCITTYMGKSFSNDWDTLDLSYSGRNGTSYQYTYPRTINYTSNVNGSSTRKTGERTIDLFQPKAGQECVMFRTKIEGGDEPFANILVAVTSNAPNLAYGLAVRKFEEASN